MLINVVALNYLVNVQVKDYYVFEFQYNLNIIVVQVMNMFHDI